MDSGLLSRALAFTRIQHTGGYTRQEQGGGDLRGRAQFPRGTWSRVHEEPPARRNRKMKMCGENEKLPQVETPSQGQSTPGSDRVKAPVATGSGEDFEGRKSCTTRKKTTNSDNETDRRLLNVLGRNRTDSVSSGGSGGSFLSTTDITPMKQRTKIGPMDELTELLQLIQRTATEMAKAAAIQKNMNMTVKMGIKRILEAADIALQKRMDAVPPRPTMHNTRTGKRPTTDNTRTEMKTTTENARTSAETTDKETPRTKRKREPTGTTPESSQKRIPTVEPAGAWKTVTRGRHDKTVKKKGPEKTDTNTKPRPGRDGWAPRKRGTAVLVKPGADKTYSDIVRTIRTTVDPTESHVQVTALRKTKNGLCLVKIQADPNEPDGRNDFRQRLQDAVGEAGSVRAMSSEVQLEIMDLDCVATAADVTNALRRETGRDEDYRVHIFGPNRAEQYMAVCDVESHEADVLVRRGRIGIGWMYCRVRKRLTVTRCHKCLGFGHVKANCTDKDRTKCCRRCGTPGHYATDCKDKPVCPLCTEAGHKNVAHLAGSGGCAMFRAALEECRRQAGRRTR